MEQKHANNIGSDGVLTKEQLSDLLGSERVQKTVREIIVAEVDERLRFNGEAYDTPWNGERADTEFIVGQAPQKALAAVYAAFGEEVSGV